MNGYLKHKHIVCCLKILATAFAVGSAMLVVADIVTGCKPSGPPTTTTSSDSFATLEEKTAFLEKYVTFRRSYNKLEYLIIFYNNGGGLPGPSDWDITIIAQVPRKELEVWISGTCLSAKPVGDWLPYFTKTIELSGVSEWFRSNRILVGIDRKMSIVVYRNSTLASFAGLSDVLDQTCESIITNQTGDEDVRI